MDNYIVSARKYRPSTFRSVVGQKSLTTTLKNAIQSNKLAHAYLFCGPRGVGKTSCARIFAKTINCLTPTSDGEACNECESCLAFNEQRSYNIHELDAASNNSVDDIRSLIDQVRIPPAIGKYKVFIIDEVHMLSSAAFNAFLKTLEEPPHHALFILATTEKHKVLPTILSRCQIYDFSRISIADMVEHLEYVLDYEYYFRLTDSILAGNVRSSILTLNEILSKGFDGQNIITGLAAHFRDLLVCKDEATLILFEVGASIRERYKEMAKRCPDQLLFKAIELANTCDLNYRASRNKRLLLELTLIQLCQLSNAGQAVDDKKKGLIEPIASGTPGQAVNQSAQPVNPGQPTRQPVQPGQPYPQQPVNKGNDNGRVIATNMPSSATVIPQSPSAAPPKKVNRPPHLGTSLKEIGVEKPKNQTVQQNTQTVQEVVTPFGEDELVRAWDAYAASIDKKVYLKNTMINCKPVLQENYFFEVGVHNPGQQDELSNGCVDLLNYLRVQLKNTRIQMRVRIIEANEKHLAYTSTEKFEHLLSVNPVLGKLKDEFNLTLD